MILVDVVILVHAENTGQLSPLRLHVILNTRELSICFCRGLAKHDVFGLPDLFAVIAVDSVERYVTSMIEKTLDPRTVQYINKKIIAKFMMDNYSR